MSASNHLYHRWTVSEKLGRELKRVSNVHNPTRPLAVRFVHLLDDEAENESGLIEESCFNDVVPQYIRRDSPPLSMLDMCIDGPLVDFIEPLGFVYHGCLSQPWAPLVRIIGDVPGNMGFANARRTVDN